MNVFEQRLRNCQVALRDAAERGAHFDMGHYAQCGSPGCVLGHYAARRDLQQDFRFTERGPVSIDGSWGGLSSQKIHQHFGIELDESMELFGWIGCGHARTALAAIDYIESFIARKWPAPSPNWNALAGEPLPVAERASAIL